MNLAVVLNPAAGGGRNHNRPTRFVAHLRRNGHVVEVLTTTGQGDATRLTQGALARGAEAIVAIGGDGTVNEVVQGMVGSPIPLVVYPAGTTNVWCKQVKMPTNPRRAAAVLETGYYHDIDLGRANNNYFLLMTGIGLDGEITGSIDLDFKRRVGKLAYALAAVKTGLQYKAGNVNIVLEPGTPGARHITLRTSLVIVTNAERYAVMKLAREAQLDDGQLELLVFQEKNIWSRLRRSISLVTSRSEHDSKISRYQVQRAAIEMENPVGMQIDGDPLGSVGSQSLNIECIPAALRVIVPHNAPSRLFMHA